MNLPRGIRKFEHRGKSVCQWIVDGKRKTRAFETKGDRDRFAASIAGDLKENGVGAFRLNPDESREWRAFRATIGEEVTLDEVLACWQQYGAKRVGITVAKAVEKYLAAKRAEGITAASLSHYGPVFDRFCARFGKSSARSITGDDIADYIGTLKRDDESNTPAAPGTKLTNLKRLRGLFQYLCRNRFVNANATEGVRGPKLVEQPIEILTVQQACALFAINEDVSAEAYARLALEAFAGLRYSTAALVCRDDIDYAERGITLPAAKIKTRRRDYIDKLPDNLWLWLERAREIPWTLTPRQYLTAKTKIFADARVPHPRNCLRHSFATYHVAVNKDAHATAVILCHTSAVMLYKHYKGAAKHPDGIAYFAIAPGAPLQAEQPNVVRFSAA